MHTHKKIKTDHNSNKENKEEEQIKRKSGEWNMDNNHKNGSKREETRTQTRCIILEAEKVKNPKNKR